MVKSKSRVRYLFKRPGSDKYWLCLRGPNKRIEKSLGTADKAEAELLAMPYIEQHKAEMLAAKPRLQVTIEYKMEPGREHAGPDGGKIIATERELIHIGHNGAIIKTEPNSTPAYQLTGKLTAGGIVRAYREHYNAPPAPPKKNDDDRLFDTYLKHANVTGFFRREAESTWALFKTLTGGKALADCKRDDGRKLAEHFFAKGNKSATVRKKVGWLGAACALAISEGKLTLNPFVGVVAKMNDKERRWPLDDADMKACKQNLATLDNADALLFRLLACSGMRLSEAFQINGERSESGIRYCIIGEKTLQSLRRVPFPAAVLPYLPKTIKGPLFAAGEAERFSDATIERLAHDASKRLNRFLRKIGITDKSKVVHSLRHRAKDQLRKDWPRMGRCPDDVAEEIFGREKVTVGAGYGKGSPVPLLRKWIDKISL
jgi:integrase